MFFLFKTTTYYVILCLYIAPILETSFSDSLIPTFAHFATRRLGRGKDSALRDLISRHTNVTWWRAESRGGQFGGSEVGFLFFFVLSDWQLSGFSMVSFFGDFLGPS